MSVDYSEQTTLTNEFDDSGFWRLKGQLDWEKKDVIFILPCFCCKRKLSLTEEKCFWKCAMRRGCIQTEGRTVKEAHIITILFEDNFYEKAKHGTSNHWW